MRTGLLVDVHPSLHALGGGAALELALFGVAALFALALAAGARTRVATVGSWVLLVSLQNRNPLVLTGADTLLRAVLFWSMFLPLGARFSWDARRARAPGPGRVANAASAALLLQIALLYPVAAVFKLREAPWRELTFLADALRVEGVATPLGRMLLGAPVLLTAGAAAALAFEAVGFLLAFSPRATGPLRTLAVFAFVSFHLAIGALLPLGLFSWVGAAAWLVFLPPWFWEQVGARVVPPGLAPSCPWPRANAALQAVVVALGLGVALHVAATLGWADGAARGRPGPEGDLVRALRLDQRWSLWSRAPTNRFYVFPARLRDGTVVDLHREGPLDWSRPRRRTASHAWWRYQLLVSQPGLAPLRAGWTRYLERRWNRGRPCGRRVAALELWMVEETDKGFRRVQLAAGDASPDPACLLADPPRGAGECPLRSPGWTAPTS